MIAPVLLRHGFLSHLRSLRGLRMSQKSLIPQPTQSVSRVLTAYRGSHVASSKSPGPNGRDGPKRAFQNATIPARYIPLENLGATLDRRRSRTHGLRSGARSVSERVAARCEHWLAPSTALTAAHPTEPTGSEVTISSAQVSYLLSGIDWRNPQETWRPTSVG
jgi:hypothetical protein